VGVHVSSKSEPRLPAGETLGDGSALLEAVEKTDINSRQVASYLPRSWHQRLQSDKSRK
jgi:hypothetical protein